MSKSRATWPRATPAPIERNFFAMGVERKLFRGRGFYGRPLRGAKPRACSMASSSGWSGAWQDAPIMTTRRLPCPRPTPPRAQGRAPSSRRRGGWIHGGGRRILRGHLRIPEIGQHAIVHESGASLGNATAARAKIARLDEIEEKHDYWAGQTRIQRDALIAWASLRSSSCHVMPFDTGRRIPL